MRDDGDMPGLLLQLLEAPAVDNAPPPGPLRTVLGGLRARAPLALPGRGQTLQRWQAFADVAAVDLVAAKLFEAHHDALAIMAELRFEPPADARMWAVWSAEPPGARVVMRRSEDAGVVWLDGSKRWCSGAVLVTHALLTAWMPDGSGPWLVQVEMADPGITHSAETWHAVGMGRCITSEVSFVQVRARVVGGEADYVSRPGFMQGGAGIAACWYGGAVAAAGALRRAVAAQSDASPFRLAALGRVDVELAQAAAVLREAAAWIDAHPDEDATVVALRARQSVDRCAGVVLDEVGRALGASPFCTDAAFARTAADLPVFVRQHLAERDMQALGKRIAMQAADSWALVDAPRHASPDAGHATPQ